MGTAFEAVDVMCPYYVKSENCEISCEGMEEGIHCRQVFENGKAKKQWMQHICNSDYMACSYARMLEKHHGAL